MPRERDSFCWNFAKGNFLQNARWSFLALWGVVFLCAVPAAAGGDIGEPTPASLGGLPFLRTTDYEKQHEGLGVGYSYFKDGIKADIYVYTAGFAEIPDGIDGRIFSDHFETVKGEVFAMESRGFYKDVRVVVPREEVKLGPHKFLHAELAFVQDGEAKESHVFLRCLTNRFFKVRLTLPVSSGDAGRETKKAFLEDLGKILAEVK